MVLVSPNSNNLLYRRQKLRTALYLYLNCSFRPAGHSSPTASPVSSTYEQTLLYRTVSLYGCPTRRCFRTISNDLIDLTRYVTGPGQKSGLQEFGASITISITITDSLRPLNGPSRQQPALCTLHRHLQRRLALTELPLPLPTHR